MEIINVTVCDNNDEKKMMQKFNWYENYLQRLLLLFFKEMILRLKYEMTL